MASILIPRLFALKGEIMASKTQRTETVRERKVIRRGKKRKAALRTKGSTKSAKALFGDK
jgi:hypothetical protein